jgi:VanZ family protein
MGGLQPVLFFPLHHQNSKIDMDRKNKNALILILLYLGFIAGGTLTPVPPIEIEIPNFDKVIHLLFYIPLGFLLSLPKIFSHIILNFFIPLAFGSFYGGMLELLQHFVAGRTSSWGDEIANVAGVGIGLGIGFLVQYLTHKKCSPRI